MGIPCACPPNAVLFGAVIGLGVFWVVELKRDPHAPFDSMQLVPII